jgi:hypothetical protein
MLSITDEAILESTVEALWASPYPRKVHGNREIYPSANFKLPNDLGAAVLSDFGDAQFGDHPFIGEVMPDLYRAPEIVLAIPWDEEIDIWAFGLMVWSPPASLVCFYTLV